jgi:hypothetical protein
MFGRGGNGAVVVSFLGKALMLSPGSEVMGLKPTPLIKLIYHRNHLRGTHKLINQYMFGRVLNQKFINSARSTRDSLHETFFSFLNKPKGF